jgi:FAD/FMN-containing dehydrogenase
VGVRLVNKVASYLQEHLVGEVLTGADVRNYFATDGGVFKVTPSMVVYPKNTQDVRKVARFSWQLAEKGHVMPITARGRGSDQGGAAIGKGIIMVFPAHMKRLLELDIKQKLARVQPGINYLTFQQTVESHGLFLPPYPSSIDYATLGGAIANNTAGEKTIKYGATRQYVHSLEVVLANGEVMQTGRISKRELDKRKGYTTFEGEIYRQVDGIITDNWDLIQKHIGHPQVSKNSAGYALGQVKLKDGSFDLTPLFVGSQGTLGIITEAIIKLEAYNPSTTLFKIDLENLEDAGGVVAALLKLEPSALEVVDKHLLTFLDKVAPNRLKGIMEGPYPSLVLLAEFDDKKESAQLKKAKQVQKALKKANIPFVATQDYDEQQRLWAIRHSAAAVIWHVEGNKKAVPIIEDGVVPREKFPEFITAIYTLFEKYKLDVAVWGHAGDANLHLQPFLDLSTLADRQKVFKIMDEYYDMVLKMGGSTCGEHNDGRLRAPFLPKVYGQEMYEVFRAVKKAFDPYGTLNAGVKIDVTMKDLVPILRNEYSMEHLADHLPRT